MRQQSRRYTQAAATVLVSSLWACNRPETPDGAPVAAPSTARLKTVNEFSPVPDLSRPFQILPQALYSGTGSDPLSMGLAIARSAGGSWLILAPRPLDDLKMDSLSGGGRMMNLSVEACIDSLKKGGNSIVADLSRGYGILFLGTEADWKLVQAAPPTETRGIAFHASSGAAILAMVRDFWKVEIQAEPALFDRRELLLARAAERRKALQQQSETQEQMSRMMRMATGRTMAPVEEPAVEFKLVEKGSLGDLIGRLADYFGGQSRELGPNRWQIAPVSPEARSALIARLKQTLDSLSIPESNIQEWAAYAEFVQTGSAAVPAEGAAALDTLATLGTESVPAIASCLDLARAPLALAAMERLADLRERAADAALAEFAAKCGTVTDPKHRSVAMRLHTGVIQVLSLSDSEDARSLIRKAAIDPAVSPASRQAARRALLARGDTEPFENAATTEWQPPEVKFTLVEAAAGNTSEAGPEAMMRALRAPAEVAPIASLTAPNGDQWAVFVHEFYGRSNDVWLARGRGGAWEEFLFTGRRFGGHAGYSEVGKGACDLVVEADRIVLKPPDPAAKAEVDKLEKQMQDPKLDDKARQALYKRYGEISGKVRGALDRQIDLPLADLRRDADSDGMLDLVEKRLGSDPARADSDGDGVPDGKDAAPLARPAASAGDRQQILQLLFAALFAGDPDPTPILVELPEDQRQEFRGARGPVTFRSGSEIGGIRPASMLRTLEFGGPERDDDLLPRDGPVRFSPDKNRAEVHYWVWKPGPMSRMYGSQGPADQLARFERRDGRWKLLFVRPLRFRHAQQAQSERSMSMYSENEPEAP